MIKSAGEIEKELDQYSSDLPMRLKLQYSRKDAVASTIKAETVTPKALPVEQDPVDHILMNDEPTEEVNILAESSQDPVVEKTPENT